MVKRLQAAYVAQSAGSATRAVARDGEARLMFDASALTKRYASEAGRDRVLMLFGAASELLVAAHCKTEVASALLRRRRDGSLPAQEFDRAWAAAQRDVADMTMVPLDAHVERFAFAAMEQGPLRGMDALHVGSALASRVDLFVTADRRQAQVARGMGLATELIEN
ncbi:MULTISPECIES: type II toxin-antitoxin system VapC family toxin [unclassified Polaromonas]|uniref:type II toxin-antitoxin system VapC family toxin n=1 Tax=unclassified Polaromonas TaxID=2638319 RepID=UPI000F07D1CB|nr:MULTISPECIES: type II toxin-antitoxin system VapC family toxin [unclassified Polaromonas]AYQ27707.1 PIN domain-containing protein [Polaromonas sp. SP1]QGJ17443.1 PIN domain-containing protein [Polaromonas sp. Pch-P]